MIHIRYLIMESSGKLVTSVGFAWQGCEVTAYTHTQVRTYLVIFINS